ncbi:MAG: TolC family protein [Candidatus Velthaea sp.]
MKHNVAAAAAGIAASFVMLAVRALAQDTPLDLRGALRYALAHNPSILSRRATLANDEAQYARLHANEYPPITGALTNTVAKQNPYAQGTFSQYNLQPATTFSQNTAQIGTQWMLFNGFNTQLAALQAKRQAEAARDDVRRAEQQLAADVTNAYYAVSVRRETVRLDTLDRAYQQALLDVARNNERVGRVAGVDVLRAQVNELRSESTLKTAQSDEATAREMLAQTIGAPPEQPFEFTDMLPEPAVPPASPATLVALAKSNRTDIASARAALAAARVTNQLIDTDRLPQLSLNAAFGNQFSPTSYGRLLSAAPGNVALPRGNPGFWSIGATESLQLGLIDYGARRAQHRAAHAGIDAASATLATTENAVETDVRQAYRGVQTTAANLATAKQASAYGAESARIAQLQYRNGLISLTDATQAERDNLQTQTDLVNARVAYIGAVVHLRVSLGTSETLAIVDMRTPS